MASPKFTISLLATLLFSALCRAGPLPNGTSTSVGLREGSCALGDVVYVSGDDFPGSDPCEKCKCSAGEVKCLKQQCEPRPGCKALHRPDHCCPTYQCECEQEGRVYGNGEKLVDPADPCRVCYCQGGEVVCRRIACFVRDDCTPRLVPGRCCPEYDNCPVRGVTTLPGVSSLPPNLLPIEEIKSNAVPSPPKENIKEITIKEITPVSEIPVITDVKIKEILPSPSIEVAEYSSSKSPLIPREATSENSVKNTADSAKTEAPTVIEVNPSQSTEIPKTDNHNNLNKDDATPSKISFSTQDSINSEIYPSNVPIVASPSAIPELLHVATTTKSPIIDDEYQSPFDHNPAFPPIPDDLSVLSNHGDDIVPEPSADIDHILSHEIVEHSIQPEAKAEEPSTTISKDTSDNSVTTERIIESSTKFESSIATESSSAKNPMINLRSAIPTEMLHAPSYVQGDVTGESDDSSTTTTGEPVSVSVTLSTEINQKEQEISSTKSPIILQDQSTSVSTPEESESITLKVTSSSDIENSSKDNEQTTSSLTKSNIATEINSQTELSSLPIETSDQKPHETDLVAKDRSISTSDPLVTSTRISTPGSEVITVSKAISNDNNVFENTETTEFILTSFGSSETATDSVELIKISGDPEKSAAIIDAPKDKTNSVLKDLISLVSDVASISDHTEMPEVVSVSGSSSISDSEELIPVNAAYKRKSNSNQNSITEIPVKSKNSSKQKIVEIEDDDTEHITDSPPPNDKIEPTTRRPIIDNVSDILPENKTEKKDIEIITQSYVPTINRRPTKVVMKQNNESLNAEATDSALVSVTLELVTENSFASSEFVTTSAEVSTDGAKLEDVSSTEGADH